MWHAALLSSPAGPVCDVVFMHLESNTNPYFRACQNRLPDSVLLHYRVCYYYVCLPGFLFYICVHLYSLFTVALSMTFKKVLSLWLSLNIQQLNFFLQVSGETETRAPDRRLAVREQGNWVRSRCFVINRLYISVDFSQL